MDLLSLTYCLRPSSDTKRKVLLANWKDSVKTKKSRKMISNSEPLSKWQNFQLTSTKARFTLPSL